MNTKKIISLAATLLITLSSVAQIPPIILGDSHVMLRMSKDARYVLLPVQEAEDIASIAVLNDRNDMVQRINVKLAVDRVDYWVPYELKGASLMDIEFHGDRRQKGAVGEFVCWKEVKFSDSFDTTNRERFRPAYHHTPQYGWMNDPNGMFYKDGVWNLYYQWNPYGSQWENMHWGHSTSHDLIHWETQPMALEPDWLGSIFSGSCVTNGSEVVAFYTSAGRHQTQSMAISKDGGVTFQKFEGNPVLTTSDVADFRDPRPFWNNEAGMWNLILAAGQEMRIYSSKDLKEWTFESSFGKEYGNHGGVWECPDLFPLYFDTSSVGAQESSKSQNIKWVLLCNINPGGPFGGSATQYFVGQFDGHKFTCESMPKVTKWLDYGKDHYATVSFYNAPENRRVVMAWMSNWQYANQVPTKQFRSANSIPRDLGLFRYGEETYVSAVPSKEMLNMRGATLKKPSEACEIVIDLKDKATVTLSNSKGEKVTMNYDAAKRTFSMDRTKSGDTGFSESFPCVTEAPTYGTIKQLRLFIDRCSIEAFDSEGKMSMTNLVFPSEPYNNIKVSGGKATIYEIKH
jgi:levanase/fructan beta-fructosidase